MTNVRWVVLFLACAIVPACSLSQPCGQSLVYEDGFCFEPAAPAALDAGDAGPSSSFGKPCAAMSECSGDAPVCGAPHLTYCTQVYCNPGEANAGACPAGFTCTAAAGITVCLKN